MSNVLVANKNQILSVRSRGQVNLAIADITWETTNTLDFGVDWNLFSDKLKLTADYCIRKTRNMLLGLSVVRVVDYPDPDYKVVAMSTKVIYRIIFIYNQ